MNERIVRRARVMGAVFAIASSVACGADLQERPKARPCPAPPEPTHQAVVVGTIGKLHMVESGYPVARLGDVMAAFKPDLVLVAARVEPFRESRLEDASFETTYVVELAKARGVPVEAIDWFREADLRANAPVDPSDEVEIDRRETEVLRAPKLYTFDRANSDDLREKIVLATSAAARHRGGEPLVARRRAWLEALTLSAASRHSKPARVLAFVDVLDRPLVGATLHGAGYHERSPSDVVANAKEVLADGAVSKEVLDLYRAQLSRAEALSLAAAGKAPDGPDASFWAERARVLSVVVEKKAACCVTQLMLEPRGP